jgi:hypothetical protein
MNAQLERAIRAKSMAVAIKIRTGCRSVRPVNESGA